jgi:O-antigen/teichoic acid export membrane protein
MNREVLLTVATRVLMLACGLVTSVLTARLLGPEGRGEYFVMVIFATTIVQFANLGLHSSNSYEVARNPKLLGGLLANSLWVSLVLGGSIALALAAGLHLSEVWRDVAPVHLYLAAAMVPPTLFFLLAGSLLVAIRRVALFNALQLGSSLMLLAALVLSWFIKGGVATFLVTTTLAWLVSAVGMMILLRQAGADSWRFRWDLFRSNWGYASRAYVLCLLSFLVVRSNVFVLNQFGSEQAGFYSVAAQIADVLWIFPTSLGMVLFPRLVRREGNTAKDMTRQLLCVGGSMFVLCLICAVLVEPFVRTMFGPAFLAAVPIMWWMLPGVLLLGLTTILSQFLAARGIPRLQIAAWLLALAVQLTASCVLIPQYAGVGAAIALTLGTLVSFVSLLTLAIAGERSTAKLSPFECTTALAPTCANS